MKMVTTHGFPHKYFSLMTRKSVVDVYREGIRDAMMPCAHGYPVISKKPGKRSTTLLNVGGKKCGVTYFANAVREMSNNR